MFLFQHITKLTCYREGQHPSLLDLILINEDGKVNDITYAPPLGKIKHVCLVFNRNIYTYTKEETKLKYEYHTGNHKNNY
jgi:hypothetical protein